MGRLIFSRSRHSSDPLWRFHVMIDGQRFASIDSGQTLVMELPPGHHEVMARIDWCRSNRLEIEVGPQGTDFLEVGSNIGMWYYLLFAVAFFLASFYWHGIILWLVLGGVLSAPRILWRNRYLYLRTVPASERASKTGSAIPHPDALPPIRLPHDLFINR